MAVNPRDLQLANGERQPKSDTSGQRTGADWHQKRRRAFKHHALAAALGNLLRPPVKS